MEQLNLIIFVLGCLLFFKFGNCLECYVCSNQDSNNDKCRKTILTCETEEEMCLTEIKWGTMPYWQAGADKQFYVSKRCATQQQCDKVIRKYMPYCTHIWYEDWKCAECCRGDRCNYFVISGSPTSLTRSFVLIVLCAAMWLRNIV